MYKRKEFFVGKKGISVMIGYVLLVVFVLIIGALVYQWLKTYVPSQGLECPDGVSLFIKEAEFDDSTSQLTITLRNNGRFNLAAYFIHATNSSDQELPIIDLSGYLNETSSGMIVENSILFIEGMGDDPNLFAPDSERDYLFDIPSSIGEPYIIRITPARYQEEDDERVRFVSCSNARAEQIVGEPEVPCEPETCESLDYNCGDWWSDGCGGTLDCEECTDPDVCNPSGQCVDPGACDETCAGLGWQCGTVCEEICGPCSESLPFCDTTQQCVECLVDGDCDSGFTCDEGQCVSNLGNGVCEDGETCENEPACEGQQAECEVGETCDGGICVFNADGGFNSCGDYCDLFTGYSAIFSCVQNINQCVGLNKVWIGDVPGANAEYGDGFCTGGNADTCCCTPT